MSVDRLVEVLSGSKKPMSPSIKAYHAEVEKQKPTLERLDELADHHAKIAEKTARLIEKHVSKDNPKPANSKATNSHQSVLNKEFENHPLHKFYNYNVKQSNKYGDKVNKIKDKLSDMWSNTSNNH